MAKKATKSSRIAKAGTHTDEGDAALLWRQPKPQVHTFTRMLLPNDIVKVPGDQNFGIAFRLSDVPDVTEFTNLFDQYRINWVDYIIMLKNPGTGGGYPTVYFAEDHDSDSTPTFNELYSSQSLQVFQFNATQTMFKIRVRPNTLRAVFNGLVNGYERSPPGTWVDCGNPSVPHYGVKYSINNYNSTNNANTEVAIVARYSISFKEAR